MMKIFAIYSVVKSDDELTELEKFRKKYDEPYELHVTLKQPVYIDDSEIDNLKQVLDTVELPESRIDVVFNEIRGDEKVLMLDAEENSDLVDLQKNILRLLAQYDSYVDVETKQYEIDFKPHITVGKDIDRELFSLAKQELESMLPIHAFIDSITLAIVDRISPEEASNSDNLTEYRF